MIKFLQSKFVFSIAILNALLYVVGALGLYVHPKYFFGFTFCTLGFPILLICLLFFFFLYLWINKRRAAFVFLILCIGYKSIGNSFAINLNSPVKVPNTLKVMSWNVAEFGYLTNPDLDSLNSKRQQILRFLKAENPDFVCLTDFTTANNCSLFLNNLKNLTAFCGYKFYKIEEALKYAVCDSGHFVYGTLILSKYPILNSGVLNYYMDSIRNEGINFADVRVNNKRARIICSHFKSIKLELTSSIIETETQEHKTIFYLKDKIGKLTLHDTIHANQALITRKFLDTTKSQIIFCADLNSVPTSYTYNVISKNLKDAFIEKGFGIGTTYSKISPTLRIDVMLVSKSINVLSYKSPKLPYSDHYPIIATLSLP